MWDGGVTQLIQDELSVPRRKTGEKRPLIRMGRFKGGATAQMSRYISTIGPASRIAVESAKGKCRKKNGIGHKEGKRSPPTPISSPGVRKAVCTISSQISPRKSEKRAWAGAVETATSSLPKWPDRGGKFADVVKRGEISRIAKIGPSRRAAEGRERAMRDI